MSTANHLAAQRALDMLNDPRLSPGHLVGLLQNDNQRRKIQLARDQFDDRLAERARPGTTERYFKRLDDEARQKAMSNRAGVSQNPRAHRSLIPHHPILSRNIPMPPGALMRTIALSLRDRVRLRGRGGISPAAPRSSALRLRTKQMPLRGGASRTLFESRKLGRFATKLPMADRARFELAVGLTPHPLSRRAH